MAAVKTVVAASDYREGKVVRLEECRSGAEAEAKGKELNRKCPEPHQEVLLGYAPSVKDWQRLYPRYASLPEEPEGEKKGRGRRKR